MALSADEQQSSSDVYFSRSENVRLHLKCNKKADKHLAFYSLHFEEDEVNTSLRTCLNTQCNAS